MLVITAEDRNNASAEYKMNQEILKIAVVGPESTGKSTMAKWLADYYKTIWVPEFARSYCENLTEDCTWQDEINMFHGQLALEKKLLPKANKMLICDTTFITVKIWSDALFGSTPQQVLDELPKQHYDLYLLLDIDMPWQDDPLRNFPNQREHFMQVWHQELTELNVNYSVISGIGEQRFENAVKAIDTFTASD